jgi:hypothetical protein
MPEPAEYPGIKRLIRQSKYLNILLLLKKEGLQAKEKFPFPKNVPKSIFFGQSFSFFFF